MAERPHVLTEKLIVLLEILADADDLQNKGKPDRPGQASVADVRSERANAVRDVMDAGGSVASVNNVKKPSERLSQRENGK